MNGQKLKWKIPLIVVKPVQAYKNGSFGLKPVQAQFSIKKL
jgi:hypothetical protein